MTIEDRIAGAIDIVRIAGGRIVGRTRLQKIACLLELSQLGYGFHFEYHHFGPYSEDLTTAIQIAVIEQKLDEIEQRANWGGIYSDYRLSSDPVDNNIGTVSNDEIKCQLIKKAAGADSLVLELATTAAYFAGKVNDPWEETKQRKFEKSQDGRLDLAKALYAELKNIVSSLPNIDP